MISVVIIIKIKRKNDLKCNYVHATSPVFLEYKNAYSISHKLSKYSDCTEKYLHAFPSVITQNTQIFTNTAARKSNLAGIENLAGLCLGGGQY
jgi:hypothetical protein